MSLPEQHSPNDSAAEGQAGGPSFSAILHALNDRKHPILFAIGCSLALCTLVTVAFYLFMPRQVITGLPFRLEFEGANRGIYPNGMKFSTAELTAQPVLSEVYKQNQLDRFTTLDKFTRAIFVLEWSREYERLAREYAARVSDAKLTPLDRKRIEEEFDLKRTTLGQANYSINFVETRGTASIPPSLVAKTLNDTLDAWARFAAVQKRALDFQLGILSTRVIERPRGVEAEDFVIAVRILRSRIERFLRNIDELKQVTGAQLIRTSADGISLDEAKIRLDDIVRFRLDPLVSVMRSAGLIKNPAVTVRFLEEQLSYDRRELTEAEQRSQVLRDALTLYVQRPKTQLPSPGPETDTPEKGAETVMPQLSDSFLDRIIQMAGDNKDQEFRQSLVEQIRQLGLLTVPLRSNVAYDQQLITAVRTAPSLPSNPAAEKRVRDQFDQIYADVSRTVSNVNEIYGQVSKNLNPSTELVTRTAPARRRVERAVSPRRMALYGLFGFLLTIPLILGLAVLHSRIHAQAAAEARALHPTPSAS